MYKLENSHYFSLKNNGNGKNPLDLLFRARRLIALKKTHVHWNLLTSINLSTIQNTKFIRLVPGDWMCYILFSLIFNIWSNQIHGAYYSIIDFKLQIEGQQFYYKTKKQYLNLII